MAVKARGREMLEDFSRRPLSEELVKYCAVDVLYLHRMVDEWKGCMNYPEMEFVVHRRIRKGPGRNASCDFKQWLPKARIQSQWVADLRAGKEVARCIGQKCPFCYNWSSGYGLDNDGAAFPKRRDEHLDQEYVYQNYEKEFHEHFAKGWTTRDRYKYVNGYHWHTVIDKIQSDDFCRSEYGINPDTHLPLY